MLTAALHVKCNSKKGRYLNDVRMGRGERGTQKANDSTDELNGCDTHLYRSCCAAISTDSPQTWLMPFALSLVV